MKPALLALLALGAAQEGATPDLPSTYSSRHYELKTSAPREQAEDLLAYMELVFDAYLKLLKPVDPAAAEKSRSTILLYKDRGEFLASGAARDVGAYYSLRTRSLVGYYDSIRSKPFFAHEGMHQFTDLTSKNYRDFPMWFSEGMADCVGNNEVRDGKLFMCLQGGTIARLRLPVIQEALKAGTAYKLDDLLGLDPKAFMADAALAYAQSWSFCHFLISYPEMEDRRAPIPSGRYRRHLEAYYERLRLGGSSHRDAWEEAFKGIPIQELEESWSKYVATFEFARRLGFFGKELTAADAPGLGLKEGRGAIRITKVVPDSVGVRAGLAEGDVILSFDGEPLPALEPLSRLRSRMQGVPYGRPAVVVVRRGEKDVELTVVWEKK